VGRTSGRRRKDERKESGPVQEVSEAIEKCQLKQTTDDVNDENGGGGGESERGEEEEVVVVVVVVKRRRRRRGVVGRTNHREFPNRELSHLFRNVICEDYLKRGKG